MKRTTIYLEPELEVRLQLEAKQRKIPMAEIVREALRQYLDKSPKRLPPGAGEFESAFTDTSERVDEVLTETGFGESRN
ncbi:MAG TPA: CopG family transcriptional regulator [Vicinamibacteria bacterium]|nr:CopG family transcriptional regulator [Vicinamibacteria bacterium]